MRASAIAATGILLVEREPAEYEVAVSGFTREGLASEAIVVMGEREVLHFLHRASGVESSLPAVAILGPGLEPCDALGLLTAIRGDGPMKRMPVVIITRVPGGEWVRSAYESGANSVVRWHEDVQVRGDRYAALMRFWIRANETPSAAQALTTLE
jgi:hypothetical protein